MPFVVKKDKSFDPMDVRLFGSVAVMTFADRLADLLQELRLPGGWKRVKAALTFNPPSITASVRVVGLGVLTLSIIMILPCLSGVP